MQMQPPKSDYVLNDYTRVEIIEISNRFLQTHHPSFSIPIPIEDIVEMSLRMQIFPIQDLEKSKRIDAFIDNTFTKIIIDKYCFDNQEQRARFSIAHEVGHMVLHKEFYKSKCISSIEEFIDFENSIDPILWNKLERQALRFAAYVLMPRKPFREIIDNFLAEVGGVSNLTYNDIDKFSNLDLKSKFNVSQKAIYNHFNDEYPEIVDAYRSLV